MPHTFTNYSSARVICDLYCTHIYIYISLCTIAFKCKKCGCVCHAHCHTLMPYNCGQKRLPISSRASGHKKVWCPCTYRYSGGLGDSISDVMWLQWDKWLLLQLSVLNCKVNNSTMNKVFNYWQWLQ